MRPSRRDFARVASLVAGAALLPRRARAQTGDSAAAAPLPMPKVGQAAQAEVSARIQLVGARWAARLSPQDRQNVNALCAELQPSLEALRAATLDGSDAPAITFRAARKPR